jgi:hypothetical protein
VLRTMYKHSANNNPAVGSRSLWLTVRIGEVLMILLLILFIPPLLLQPRVFHTEGKDVLFLGIFASLLLGGFSQAHQVVYGFSDDGGLHYKRYFRWRNVSWGEIDSITRRPMGMILVDVERYSFFNRHLVFIQDTVLFGEQPKFVSFESLRNAWVRAQQLRAEPSGNG